MNVYYRLAGVYYIKNNINGKIYIGESTDIPSRWRSHIIDLRNGEHDNTALQDDYLKYGYNNFSFGILEYIIIPDGMKPNQHIVDYIKVEMVLLMREFYYQNLYDKTQTYNVESTLRKVYQTNVFPNIPSSFSISDLNCYDYHKEIGDNKSLFTTENAAILIYNYFMSKDLLPIKPNCSRPIETESLNSKKTQYTPKKSEVPDILPDFIKFIKPYNPSDMLFYKFQFDEINKSLNENAESNIPHYSCSVIYYYLVVNKYLAVADGAPKYIPTDKSFNEDLFYLSATPTEKNFKLYITSKGKQFMDNIISNIEEWIKEIPTFIEYNPKISNNIIKADCDFLDYNVIQMIPYSKLKIFPEVEEKLKSS